MAHGLILSDWKIPCTMKKKSILFVLAAICLPLAVSAQKEREITLNEAIAMARMQSVDAAVALNELKTSYWEYRTFRADLLPEILITINLTAPIRIRTVLTALSVTAPWGFPVSFPSTRISGLPVDNFH